MERYECESRLVVTCRQSPSPGRQQVIVQLRHQQKHKPYYDVSMPAEAASMIRNDVEWYTPVSMVPRIQALFPVVTAQQIHKAWTVMSETLWKRDLDQLESVRLLLGDRDDVDVFKIDVDDGVEQVCWGMRNIAVRLRGEIVEVAVDATCEFYTKLSKP
jgi:hypothetical protein